MILKRRIKKPFLIAYILIDKGKLVCLNSKRVIRNKLVFAVGLELYL